MNSHESQIQFVCYKGACGPTIMVLVPNFELMLRLRAVFLELSQSLGKTISLPKELPSKVENMDQFLLKSCGTKRGGFTLHRRWWTGRNIFTWTKSPEGWEDTYLLLDGPADGRWHQYLTIEGLDDASVQVSYRERLI